MEYDDEYDDSFDDLSGGVADGNIEAEGHQPEADSSAQQQHHQPPPQRQGGKPLYVLDGKVYNYNKVSNSAHLFVLRARLLW